MAVAFTLNPETEDRRMAKPMSKSATIAHLAQKTNLTKKQVVDVFEQHRKLVAAQSSDEVRGSSSGQQDVRDAAQHVAVECLHGRIHRARRSAADAGRPLALTGPRRPTHPGSGR